MIWHFIIGIISCILFSNTNAQCYDGDVFHDGRCFRFETTPMTFDKAEIACEMSFYELISINNAFENAYVASLAQPYLDSYDYFWIGLTRPKGIWYWEDASHVTYTNWKNGEPKDNQDFAAYQFSTNKWVAFDNTTKLPFFCGSSARYPVTTSQPGATTKKLCTGGLFQHWGDYCYSGTWSELWNDPLVNELYCQAVEKSCHQVSIANKDENDLIQWQVTIGFSTWLGLVGSSVNNVTWTDNSPLQYTNWYNEDGTFGNHSCKTGNCCGVMIGVDLDSSSKHHGKWFLADCVVEPNDYTIKGGSCKAPF